MSLNQDVRMQKGWIVRVRSAKSNTKGWQARVPFGKVVPETKSRRFRSRLFSDTVHGGSLKAKRAAMRWLKSATAEKSPRGRKKR
jgi:hypothetical protein